MIKAVSVTNHSGETLRCVLESPEFSGFSITDITGIVPGKSEIGIKELTTLDGGFFQTAKMPSRNIVISYVFHDYWIEENESYTEHYRSIEAARLEFYKFFVVKKQVTLLFETDLHRYKISGYVESNEPEIFSSQEGAQVSIICPDPYFHLADDGIDEEGNLSETIFSPNGGFEFQFSNQVYYKTLKFKDLDETERTKTVNLYYDGDVDTGVIFHVFISGTYNGNLIDFDYHGKSADNPLQTTLRFNNQRFLANGGGLQVGDELIISTIPGHKYAYVQRGTERINVFYCVDVFSDWILLQKGNNYIVVKSGVIYPVVPDLYITAEHQILFAGI